jgi:ribosomal protein S26
VEKEMNPIGKVFLLLTLVYLLYGCEGDRVLDEPLTVSTQYDAVPEIQYQNAYRLLSKSKAWKKTHGNSPFNYSTIDSIAKASIFKKYDYSIAGPERFHIMYVTEIFFEVIFIPERKNNEIVLPYYLVTPDTLYKLNYDAQLNLRNE